MLVDSFISRAQRGRLLQCARSAPGRTPHGHVVALALGGGVHEDELFVIHGYEIDVIRTVRIAPLQNLNTLVI